MKIRIVIVTGLSGSGKSVALRSLEDSGFFCVDNLPPELIDSFASTMAEKSAVTEIAVGIDVREKAFLSSLDRVLDPLRKKYNIYTLFLEAEKDVLIRRFKETRRPHPLVANGSVDMQQAIDTERGLLGGLREGSDRVIDTSSFTPHQLRHLIISIFGGRPPGEGLVLTLMSFGYKFGIPQNVDILLDVRFLPNPYFVAELKDKTGLEQEVRKFIFDFPVTGELIDRLASFLGFLIPLYLNEGRAYFTIGIGCTGGRHRSPAIVEEIAYRLKRPDVSINTVHRDL